MAKRRPSTKGCGYSGCPDPHWALGYCGKHYSRLKRTGTVELIPRTKMACMADGCAEPVNSNGLCTKHYRRLRSTGRLDLPTVVERLMNSYTVDEATGCWLWTGKPDVGGYARMSIGNALHYAHRVSYETFIGPIPDGMTIDHVRERGCVHRHCINPNHTEPVTLAENSRRGALVRWSGARGSEAVEA